MDPVGRKETTTFWSFEGHADSPYLPRNLWMPEANVLFPAPMPGRNRPTERIRTGEQHCRRLIAIHMPPRTIVRLREPVTAMYRPGCSGNEAPVT